MKDKKKTLAIVGPGNLGRVLALALHAAGYRITEIVSRESSKAKAGGVARSVGARLVTLESAEWNADVVWLCVPDDAIATVAKDMAARKRNWKDKIVLHSSGALAANELAALKPRGAAIGSVHPMNTFVGKSMPSLAGTPFAVEGDVAAVRVAEEIASDLNDDGRIFKISKKQKPLYHALGSFASPLLISLLAAGESVARKARISDPKQLTEKLIRQTLDNYFRTGAEEAFSGPIRRGDVATIKKHLQALKRVPGAKEVYFALAKNALAQLPVKRAKEIEALLNA